MRRRHRARPALPPGGPWTSHEALLLDYEEALARRDPDTGEWFDGSAHMLWIGERTRAADGAHVAFLAACRIHRREARSHRLDRRGAGAVRVPRPEARAGTAHDDRAHGAARVASVFRRSSPARDAGHPVVWASDPMHGNTVLADDGRKTRHFDDVIGELEGFFDVCAAERVWPGGIHVELTGGDVTECLGGGDRIRPQDL